MSRNQPLLVRQHEPSRKIQSRLTFDREMHRASHGRRHCNRDPVPVSRKAVSRFVSPSCPTSYSDRLANLETRDATAFSLLNSTTIYLRSGWTRDGKMRNFFTDTSRETRQREQGEKESTTHGRRARMRI